MWLRPGCSTHSNGCLKGVASEPGDDGAAGLEPGDPSGAAAPVDGAGILPADRCLAGAGPCCVGCRCRRCLLRRTRYAARQLPSVAGLTAPPPFFFFCMSTGQEQTNTLPRVFAIAELAQHLRLSRRTIVSALSSGVLDHYRVGSRALIPEPAVIAWLESQRVGRRARLRVA